MLELHVFGNLGNFLNPWENQCGCEQRSMIILYIETGMAFLFDPFE